MEPIKKGFIQFVPACSWCGARIDGIVDVELIPIHADADQDFYSPPYEITPNRCPVCGAVFTRVALPTSLPFEGDRS